METILALIAVMAILGFAAYVTATEAQREATNGSPMGILLAARNFILCVVGYSILAGAAFGFCVGIYDSRFEILSALPDVLKFGVPFGIGFWVRAMIVPTPEPRRPPPPRTRRQLEGTRHQPGTLFD